MNWNDARVLISLARGQPQTGSHAERLEAFYGPQASYYDAFRERLLKGRQDLIHMLKPTPGAYVVELGGGTGRNLLYFGDALDKLGLIEIVDLCPALLQEARRRTSNLNNVNVVEADAVTYRPTKPVDCVYFSYALTMIPDWRGAMHNAITMLAPGGTLGVVDFYVSKAVPEIGMVRHNMFTRMFWPRWFGHDGVRLNPEHLPHLRQLLPNNEYLERYAAVPYMLGLKVPYYIFVGHKPC